MKRTEKILLDVVLKAGANIQVYSLVSTYFNSKKKDYIKTTKYLIRWQTASSEMSSWNEHWHSYRTLRSVMKVVKEMESSAQFMNFYLNTLPRNLTSNS